MKRYSEQDILKNIADSAQDVYEFVFLNFYNELCIYALGIIKDKFVAEEIVQDVFVKLWENRDALTIRSSIKAYLYRSVHNFCINHLEHQSVKRKHASASMKDYSNLISPVSPDYPIANLLVQELEDKINQSISELPNQCREIFLLVRYEDLSYSEVALKLGISVNTVKTQLQRALTRLRESLKDYLPIIIGLFL